MDILSSCLHYARVRAMTEYSFQQDMQVQSTIAHVVKTRHILLMEFYPKINLIHFEVFTWLQHGMSA